MLYWMSESGTCSRQQTGNNDEIMEANYRFSMCHKNFIRLRPENLALLREVTKYAQKEMVRRF